MQVIGICRFSWPGIGGFQVEHETLRERTAYLYDPARLEQRFRYFECFTLPCIRAQFDPDFTFLIVIGPDLPAPWRQRLERLVADVPQAVIDARPPGQHRAAMQVAINAVRRDTGEPCLQFRLDDDDAVSVGFVHRLRDAAAQVAGLMRDNRHVAIDFSDGYIARPSASGIAAQRIHKPFWTAGLAVMFRPDVPLSVMNFSHNRLGRRMPSLQIPEPDMMLRGFSDGNDSRQKPGVAQPELEPLDAEGELRFRMAYNIDADHVRAVFGAAGS